MSCAARFSSLSRCCGLSACAYARSPERVLPSLDRFKSHATQTVDIDVGPFKLAIAGWFLSSSDPETAAARDLIKACKSVRIRSYEFGSDFEYPQAGDRRAPCTAFQRRMEPAREGP